MVNLSSGTPIRQIIPPRIPEIAERLNDIMKTRKGRKSMLSALSASSKTLMGQIGSWIDEELESLRQQLDLLEMARWDLSFERKELSNLEVGFDEIKSTLEEQIKELSNLSSGQEPTELIEKYISTLGDYVRSTGKLDVFIANIDRRSKDLMTYRDSLVDLLTDYRQQTSP